MLKKLFSLQKIVVVFYLGRVHPAGLAGEDTGPSCCTAYRKSHTYSHTPGPPQCQPNTPAHGANNQSPSSYSPYHLQITFVLQNFKANRRKLNMCKVL